MSRTNSSLKLSVFLLILGLTASCSEGNSSSSNGSSEVSVCTKLKDRIMQIEDDASIIAINPEARPTNLELFGIDSDLAEAGIPRKTSSAFAYAAVIDFLDAAGSCLSDDAYTFLNNYLESPLVKALREADGN